MDQSAIVDRRRLRRKLTFWRAAAFIVLALALIGSVASSNLFAIGGKSVDHIARIEVTGLIQHDEDLLKRLDEIKENDYAKGVIVTISSPGGTTFGGETIYNAVRKVAEEKPVAAEIRTLAASAGYMIASAGDHIVAGETSIVGSIGVIFQYAQVEELLTKVGVSFEEIKSSPLKAEPSPFHTASEEAKTMIREMILDSYDWFVDIVVDRRGMDRAKVLPLADGRIFTGRQAVENGLVDTVGGEDALRAWFTEKGLSEKLEIVAYERAPDPGNFMLIHALLKGFESITGRQIPFSDQLANPLLHKLHLDGLVSVWQFGAAENE